MRQDLLDGVRVDHYGLLHLVPTARTPVLYRVINKERQLLSVGSVGQGRGHMFLEGK